MFIITQGHRAWIISQDAPDSRQTLKAVWSLRTDDQSHLHLREVNNQRCRNQAGDYSWR